jgi:hypothetical protein
MIQASESIPGSKEMVAEQLESVNLELVWKALDYTF